MRCRESHTEVIAMFDLETNKAIALRLIEVFNGRRLDLLEDVLHPEFRGRGISACSRAARTAYKTYHRRLDRAPRHG